MRHALDVPAIVTRYQSGSSVASLSRELGVDSSTVKGRLVAAGVPIRGTKEAFVADPSICARITGRPRTYPVNSAFFDVLTPDVSYVVGLLQADGFNQVGRGVVGILLKRSDAKHLRNVLEVMGASRPLRADKNDQLYFRIQSRLLSAGLARWGVVSPKTHTASTHPTLLLDHDYWRGVVDGDGTLCDTGDGRKILALVGSQAVCEQFLAFCRHHGAGARCNVHRNRSIYTAKVSGADAVHMAGVLYGHAGLALDRKSATAIKWGAA